jgi:DNA-binding CsgD family transcriptional regulator
MDGPEEDVGIAWTPASARATPHVGHAIDWRRRDEAATGDEVARVNPDVGAGEASRPSAGPRPEGSHPLRVISARRVERLLVRVRYLMAVVVAAMALLFAPASWPVAVLVVVVLVAANAVAHRRLDGLRSDEDARSLARVMVSVDATAALVTYGLFLTDVRAMPVALIAFLVFMLSLRFGRWGMVLGLGGFLVALGVRVALQRSVLVGGGIRIELVVLWCTVAVLLVGIAHELRVQEDRWRSALAARERLAEDLRRTVTQTLAYARIDPRDATHAEVLEAVRDLVASSPGEREVLIDRVATVLAVPHHGLSPREQEILLLLARGYSDARIARALFISPSTVRNHLHNMRGKLDLATRDELREFATRYAPPA